MYKDPYLLNGGPIYKLLSRVKSFLAVRNIENEFVDFRSYNIDSQFREINENVYKAFLKNDKVNMQRSLSEAMFTWAVSLRTVKKQNPFLKDITEVKYL